MGGRRTAVLARAYAGLGLADVLPAVARSLGVELGPREVGRMSLPPSRRAVVVLVDGLGRRLLEARRGHAPFLRSALEGSPVLQSGFPSTTATSMGTFGTGLPPGAHGLVGYQVLVPGEDRTFNELAWDEGVDPFAWQPHETVFQRCAAAGVSVTRVGPHFFDGSGLTNAALRGGAFQGAKDLDARVEVAARAAGAADRSLVYLYWGDLDKVGHVHGWQSPQWTAELEAVDAQLARLATLLPDDSALHVTADHGMVDIPLADRLDVAVEADLAADVRHVGGEPRALQLYLDDPRRTAAVTDRWSARLGQDALVLTREEVVERGWFGAVEPRVLPRIGDVVVAMTGSLAVVDTRVMRPELVALLGVHGSVTDHETAIPLLTYPARSAR
ncbi:alkaline phosphatase family protein [Arsenicicoccus sp. oral taxon 190]|uniref:alkaline phosphatase family protein n=1 Tax=Arsenicicoccus sp. oral taxon 190 TaxID=1658671 RepID=UPI00067A4385|nr:nucleotide pyrophosphatase/phosphodiesterase family protein [Arsenicicoccus sp. oral taxon 190]AKT52017.1 nucleotide pyrophosphatase [Arsenicicoccus sp. oral taxon 190]